MGGHGDEARRGESGGAGEVGIEEGGELLPGVAHGRGDEAGRNAGESEAEEEAQRQQDEEVEVAKWRSTPSRTTRGRALAQQPLPCSVTPGSSLLTGGSRHRVAGHDEKNRTHNGGVQSQIQRVKGDTERGALIHTYTMTIT